MGQLNRFHIYCPDLRSLTYDLFQSCCRSRLEDGQSMDGGREEVDNDGTDSFIKEVRRLTRVKL